MANKELCAECKGARRLCGRPRCPILARLEISHSISRHLNSTTLFGASPPSVLVGEWNYPEVFIGPNIPPVGTERAGQFEDPTGWWGTQSLDDIIRLRSSMIFSRFKTPVKSAHKDNPLLQKTQELALSVAPIDAEATFFKPPRVGLTFDGVTKPVGPTAPVKSLTLAGNPVVPRPVDRLVYDTDAHSMTAMRELYTSGISVYDIQRLLSVGLLGMKFQRRLVPTRWSITATDSTVSRQLLEKVKEFPEISEFRLHRSEYLDNHYQVILLPGAWSMEMVEIWLPRSVWVQSDDAHVTVVWEKYDGKVSAMDGGYYAIRLPVVEHLLNIKRQATAIAFREVGAGYYAPVGNWQIRESVKQALTSKPLLFNDLSSVLNEVFSQLSTPSSRVWKESKLLKDYRFQKKITQFLT